MHTTIDISSGWRIFPRDFDTGFLGQAGRPYQRDFEPDDCVTASVPVTAQAAWFAAGRIPDPYIGMNNRDILWMEQKEWWFLKDFDLPRLDGVYRLTFQGVNYRAEAWLNDVQLGVWEGSFLTQSFDLDPALLREKGNRLAVRVRTQERAWEDGTQPNERGFQNSSAHIRTQRPTPQYAYGWNWSPHLIAVGIWRPVVLEWTQTARFGETRIHAAVGESLDTAAVRFRGVVERLDESDEPLLLRVSVRAPGGEARESVCRVGRGGVRYEAEVDIPDPQLWFPNGFGPQPLYEVEATLETAGGEICDRRTRRVGFRRIEFVPNTNDEGVLAESGQSNRLWSIVGKPYPWTLVVNGVRIFSKGTNWCPVDNLYRDRDAHVRRLLELARDAHYVFIRVWGGGLTESDYFYDCCDELGLLCLQEFWFACGSAPAMDRRIFLENARSEIIRLRERTSIAFWGGGNEFNPDNPENKPIIDAIAALVAEVDGTREFRRGSPYRGDRHGGLVSTPYYTTNKYRDLLPGRRRLVLLRSECAVGRSPARPESISKFVPAESRWPIDWTVYQNHHAQHREWEQVSRPFGEASSWEQALLHAAVFHCIDSRMNMEFSRANKYECSGCWTWQLNASWPSFHREHIDWFGCPKPVYYWYRNACKPIIGLVDFERFVWHPGEVIDARVFAVNDTHAEVSAAVRLRVFALDGRCEHEAVRPVVIPPDASVDLGALGWRVPPAWAASACHVALETTVGDEVVHRNFYYVAVSPDTVAAEGVTIAGRARLEYLGRSREVSLPNYFTLAEIVDEPTEHDKQQKRAASEELTAEYVIGFDVPEHLRGRELEVHLPAVSGDDVVVLNGVEIGRGEMDPAQHWNYEADPLRWPYLPARYYAIPADVLRDAGNELRIRVSGERLAEHTDKRFGLTRPVALRPRTPEAVRRRVAAYDREMGFFRPVTEGPKANLRLTVDSAEEAGGYRVTVENTGPAPAVFVVLDLEGEAGVPFRFDEGAFAGIPPGEAEVARLAVEGTPPPETTVVARLLNGETVAAKLS